MMRNRDSVFKIRRESNIKCYGDGMMGYTNRYCQDLVDNKQSSDFIIISHREKTKKTKTVRTPGIDEIERLKQKPLMSLQSCGEKLNLHIYSSVDRTET